MLWSHYTSHSTITAEYSAVLTDMSCKWNEMTNLPNRDDREAKIYYCGPRAVENLLLLKKWFRWLRCCCCGCRNFHHQDWPSLRDNDRHHVVAPPSTAAAALTHIHTRSSLVARFSKETFVCVQSCYFALPVCRCAQATYPA